MKRPDLTGNLFKDTIWWLLNGLESKSPNSYFNVHFTTFLFVFLEYHLLGTVSYVKMSETCLSPKSMYDLMKEAAYSNNY